MWEETRMLCWIGGSAVSAAVLWTGIHVGRTSRTEILGSIICGALIGVNYIAYGC